MMCFKRCTFRQRGLRRVANVHDEPIVYRYDLELKVSLTVEILLCFNLTLLLDVEDISNPEAIYKFTVKI